MSPIQTSGVVIPKDSLYSSTTSQVFQITDNRIYVSKKVDVSFFDKKTFFIHAIEGGAFCPQIYFWVDVSADTLFLPGGALIEQWSILSGGGSEQGSEDVYPEIPFPGYHIDNPTIISTQGGITRFSDVSIAWTLHSKFARLMAWVPIPVVGSPWSVVAYFSGKG